jgi:hypothetical protein
MTTVYPIGRLVFTQKHGVSDNINAYIISDGCFHIQNTQEPLFAKELHPKSDTTIDSIITDAMNSVLIEY